MTIKSAFANQFLGRIDEKPEIYIGQVEHLFGQMKLFLMGAFGVLAVDLIAYHVTGDEAFLWIAALLLLMTGIRARILTAYDKAKGSLPEEPTERVAPMRRWEMIYALATMVFSIVVGMFTYESMVQVEVDLHVYVAFFASIFAGNFAIRNATRPRIVAVQVGCIMLPFTAGVFMGPIPNYWWLLLLIPMQMVSIRSTTILIHDMLMKAMLAALKNTELAKHLNAALDHMSHGLCMADKDGKVLVLNKQFRTILDISEDQIKLGHSLQGALYGITAASIVDGSHAEETRMVTLPNTRIVELRMRPISGGGILVVAEDVTERETAALRIQRMAHYDELTNLPNRVLFRQEIEDRLAAEKPFALLCLDLDHFKEVNDTLGHPMGDRLLVDVAARLRNMIRGTDFVARLGGDEFMVIVEMDHDEEAVSLLAERMVARISMPYRIHEHDITVGLSVGVAFSAVHGDGPDDLVKNADMALYKSKRAGRGRYCVFRASMDVEAQERRQMEIDMRLGIVEETFTVAFQPIVTATTGKVSTCEALVRWVNRDGRPVYPDKFIPIAEETGMIVEIGAIVLRKACREAMRWPNETRVAVNLSDVQFRRNVVVAQVTEALRLSGLPAHRLEVEITESLAMENLERTLSVLGELRKMGVRIALDDFGTGHTSLSYLHKIPFDKVKIDRSFIQDLATNHDAQDVVRFVATMMERKEVDVVAEGVEKAEQVDMLAKLNVNLIQGWFYAKAQPGDEVLDFLHSPPPGRARLRVVA